MTDVHHPTSMDIDDQPRFASRQGLKTRTSRGTALGDITNRIRVNDNNKKGLTKAHTSRHRNGNQEIKRNMVARSRRSATSHMLSNNSTMGSSRPLKASRRMELKFADDMEIINMSDEEEDSPTSQLEAVDRDDMKNSLTMAEYANDIYTHMRRTELQYQVSPGYMERQRDLNARMREILIDWLVEVHLKFKLEQESLYLTVSTIDRFLSKRAVTRSKLQLVGCAAMLVASKYEEIYAPEVQDFEYISDQAYNREQILAMETILLGVLGFELTVPSSLRFSRRLLKVAGKESDLMATHLVDYLMEMTLQDIRFLEFLPSMLASSALFLALYLLAPDANSKLRVWSPLLVHYTQYQQGALRPCVNALWRLLRKENPKYRAVRNKYSSSKFGAVALANYGSESPPFR